MRKLILVTLLSGAAWFGLPTVTYAQGNVGCVATTNHSAVMYRNGYGSLVSHTDQGSVKDRATLGLPSIPDAQVTISSDTTVCRIASAAYDSAVRFPAPNEAPLVLKIGTTQYVVIKGIESHGGSFNVVFNQAFTVAQKTIWF